MSTTQLPFPDHTFDYAFTILAAHEIRDRTQRLVFFKELARVTKPTGHIFVTEHLRDLNNFVAYTLGAFHFYTKANWQHLFKQAELSIAQQIKTTPFITTFVLKKHGATS